MRGKGRPRSEVPDEQIERLHSEQGWGARRIYAHLVEQGIDVSFATVQRRLTDIRRQHSDLPPSKVQPDPPDGYMSMSEAARLLGQSRQWLHQSLPERDLKRDGRRVWVSRQSIQERLAEAQETA